MRAPGRVIVSDVAVGNLIQQGPKSRFSQQDQAPELSPSALAGDDPPKSPPNSLISVNGGGQNAADLPPVTGTSPLARS
jgi:hypothetical protein